jgi:hypothetical protein
VLGWAREGTVGQEILSAILSAVDSETQATRGKRAAPRENHRALKMRMCVRLMKKAGRDTAFPL